MSAFDPRFLLAIGGLILTVLILLAIFILALARRRVPWVLALLVIVVFITLGVTPVSLKLWQFEGQFESKKQQIQKLEREVTRCREAGGGVLPFEGSERRE